MFNYNAWVRSKLEDRTLSTPEYLKFWNEWNDIVWRQKVLDEQARLRSLPQQ